MKQIEEIVQTYKGNSILGFKNLRARRCGPDTDIEITLIFPANMSIFECHKICDDVENLIKQRLGQVKIMTHAEPENNE